jgi:uncharacterized protein (TIGR02246 family)
MRSTAERAEIEALFHQLVRAHADRDADAIVEAYAPDAVMYDLAPPRGRRGMHRDSIVAWLAGWDGPIQIEARDVHLTVDGDVAFAAALNRMRGRQSGEAQNLWYRTTMGLQKTNGRWRIVHEHASVPFYMDGSYRAAGDLQPSWGAWDEGSSPMTPRRFRSRRSAPNTGAVSRSLQGGNTHAASALAPAGEAPREADVGVICSTPIMPNMT